jgi:hypothetical protein
MQLYWDVPGWISLRNRATRVGVDTLAYRVYRRGYVIALFLYARAVIVTLPPATTCIVRR